LKDSICINYSLSVGWNSSKPGSSSPDQPLPWVCPKIALLRNPLVICPQHTFYMLPMVSSRSPVLSHHSMEPSWTYIYPHLQPILLWLLWSWGSHKLFAWASLEQRSSWCQPPK
jgi:hypothetical protein